MKEFETEMHQFVPKHTVLGENERGEMLKKFGITLRHLPRILSSDPAIVDKNCKIGDVVKIERESKTAGKAVYYRVVVKG